MQDEIIGESMIMKIRRRVMREIYKFDAVKETCADACGGTKFTRERR